MTVITTGYAVLDRFEHNGYHDSYFHEITWDGSRIEVVETGSTAYAGAFFSSNPAATSVQDAAARRHAATLLTDIMIKDAGKRALEPHPGRTVRSTTSRGKNVGVTGLVKRVELNNYADNRQDKHYRLLIVLDGGELRWLDASRIEVTAGFGEVNCTVLAERARQIAANTSWLSLARLLGLRK